jgi:hypothetical protein
MTKSRGILPPKRWWTPAEEQAMRERYPHTPTAELAAALGRTAPQMHAKARCMGLHKSHECKSQMARDVMANPNHPGRATQIKPGAVPPNKGLRRPGWAPGNMARCQFKPGNLPSSWRPVGTYTINPEGHLDIKVNDDPGPRHVRWKPVYRVVWEAAHGPVPDGHLVVFKPGRATLEPTHITLDAVELVTRAEHMRRNSIHTLPPELKEVAILRGAINSVITKKLKKAEANAS